ncbi:MAG: hypothetical protein WC337_10095, partial [Candidatus Muiribacteriota bacterium]
SDFFAGFADTITFNATGKFRQWLDYDDVVDKGSWSYFGGIVSGQTWVYFTTKGIIAKAQGHDIMVKIGYHTPHHNFNNYFKNVKYLNRFKNLGRRYHIEIIQWQKGIQESQKIFRLPLWK